MHTLLLLVGGLAVAGIAGSLVAPQDFDKSVRYPAIEPFRAILALMVLWSHAVRMPGMFAPAPGAIPVWAVRFSEHAPLQTIGSLAVAFFFCITGFLFWARPMPRNISAFLEGRVRRLVPAYFAVATLVALLISATIDWGSNGAEVAQRLRQLASFYSFGFSDTSAHPSTHVLIGMAWSLAYEWGFYLALPLLWVLRERHRWLAHSVFVYGAFFLLSGMASKLSLYLWAGMVAAEIVPALQARLAPKVIGLCAWGGAAAFLGVVALGQFEYQFRWVPLIFFIFLSVVLCQAGQGPLGKAKVLARMGHMAYSLYLVHGVVLYVLFIPLARVMPVAEPSQVELFAALATMLAVILARKWFDFFEAPFLRSPVRKA